MTKVYRQIQDVKLTNNTILTIGTFDGVHLGHKKILNQLLQKKQETGFETFVFTFDPHPRKVLFPEQSDLKLITETEEKINLLNNQVLIMYCCTHLIKPSAKFLPKITSVIYL